MTRLPTDTIAHRCKRHRFPADKRHLDEMVVSINGQRYWLWRAVDAQGYVLDALLQSRRSKKAALRLMRKLLRSQGVTPRVMVADKLRSYSAAKAELIPGIEHRSHKGLNNRAENSHLAMRRRKRGMMRFKSARQCQRFVSIHGPIANLFHLHRKHLSREMVIGVSFLWDSTTTDQR